MNEVVRVPAVSDTAYQISGPIGATRAVLMLPCRHQRASLADPYNSPAPARRTCQTCGRRYEIEIRLGTGLAVISTIRKRRNDGTVRTRRPAAPGEHVGRADKNG